MQRRALITGLESTELTEDERRFLRDARPLGIILFSRNCVSHDQIRRLVTDAISEIGTAGALVLIDQEGGRVQRLRPPLGRALPPAEAYARRYEAGDCEGACAAAEAAARLVARDLLDLGINTNCTPVLDLPVAGAHAIIGDRAFGTTVEQVVHLGRAVADGFMAAGVLPVIKHIPGHGRATKDSHHDLPVVDTSWDELSRTDFAPFRALAHVPAAMTAHVVFSAVDPDAPASTSPKVIGNVIREEIGYDGLLMSDDLGMHALRGGMRDRAEAVIRAGSDVALHCSGIFAEMEAAATGVPDLEGDALRRALRALSVLDNHGEFDTAEAERLLAEVITGHTGRSESV
ncbi:MAG: beta-N-acetylhexosaminidase [Hyphomicrobium sp.]|jgi:beta-N-acetylhexosaminidase|nr:beta-N-acetylhexosaminidase [Hyphomicrobium sp.]